MTTDEDQIATFKELLDRLPGNNFVIEAKRRPDGLWDITADWVLTEGSSDELTGDEIQRDYNTTGVSIALERAAEASGAQVKGEGGRVSIRGVADPEHLGHTTHTQWREAVARHPTPTAAEFDLILRGLETGEGAAGAGGRRGWRCRAWWTRP